MRGDFGEDSTSLGESLFKIDPFLTPVMVRLVHHESKTYVSRSSLTDKRDSLLIFGRLCGIYFVAILWIFLCMHHMSWHAIIYINFYFPLLVVFMKDLATHLNDVMKQ